MPNFRIRSNKKELLDSPGIQFNDIKVNLQELNIINKFLGGHSINCEGVTKIIKSRAIKSEEPIIICEIGCGGGDNLASLNQYLKNKHYCVNFIGIDLKPECILYAQQQYPNLNCQWLVSDYRDSKFTVKPHIIFSSLFCHHFQDNELIEQFMWMRENSQYGFFINDLHRHIFSYYAIKILTQIFSNSYLAKNDAPISVLRGFKQRELQNIFRAASIDNFSIKWKWAFRYLGLIIK
jgi:2-polyprenyl-3-methyl-5-hydroxy-6-metoxy-1,4-benzoquinol methylase